MAQPNQPHAKRCQVRSVQPALVKLPGGLVRLARFALGCRRLLFHAHVPPARAARRDQRRPREWWCRKASGCVRSSLLLIAPNPQPPLPGINAYDTLHTYMSPHLLLPASWCTHLTGMPHILVLIVSRACAAGTGINTYQSTVRGRARAFLPEWERYAARNTMSYGLLVHRRTG